MVAQNTAREFIIMCRNNLQHILKRKLRYCPSGNTLRESMHSFFDDGRNYSGIILGTEGLVF